MQKNMTKAGFLEKVQQNDFDKKKTRLTVLYRY